MSNHVGFEIWFLGRVVAQGVLVAATLPISLVFCPNFSKSARKRKQAK